MQRRQLQEQSRQKYCRAAGNRHKKQISLKPCGQKTHDECGDAGPDVVSRSDDRGESHDCKRDIRHIVQKRAEPRIRDLFSKYKERKHPDAVDRKAHDQKRRINTGVHISLLLSLLLIVVDGVDHCCGTRDQECEDDHFKAA